MGFDLDSDQYYGLKLYNAAFYRDLQPIDSNFGHPPQQAAVESADDLPL